MRRRLMTTMAALAIPLTLTGCQGTGQLGGTSWTVVEVLSIDQGDIAEMDLDFGTDGHLTTVITKRDGTVERRMRRYHVYESLLVVSRPEGDLQLLHRIDGNEMHLTDESFQARLVRADG